MRISEGVATILFSVGLASAFGMFTVCEGIPLVTLQDDIATWRIVDIARLASCLILLFVSLTTMLKDCVGWRNLSIITFSAGAIAFAAESFLSRYGIWNDALVVSGLFLVSLSALAMVVAWLYYASTLPSGFIRDSLPLVLVFTIVPNAIATCELPVDMLSLVSMFAVISSWLVSMLLFCFLWHGSTCAKHDDKTTLCKGSIFLDAKVLTGLLALAVAGRFEIDFVSNSGWLAPVFSACALLAAAVIAWFFFVKRRGVGYIDFLRTIATLLVVAYVASGMNWDLGGVTSFIAQMAGQLFYFGLLIAAVDMAAVSENPPFTICVMCVLQMSGNVIDVLALASPSLYQGFVTSNNATVLGLALAFVAVWLLNERSIEHFVENPYGGVLAKPVLNKRAGKKGAMDTVGDSYSLKSYQSAAQLHGFTPKETEICVLLMEGRSIPFIAESLVVSGNTVKSHVSRMYTKVGVHTRQEFISKIKEGIERDCSIPS